MPAGSTLRLAQLHTLDAAEVTGPRPTLRAEAITLAAPEADLTQAFAAAPIRLPDMAAPQARGAVQSQPSAAEPSAMSGSPFDPAQPQANFETAPEFSEEDEDYLAAGIIDGTIAMQEGDDQLTIEGTVIKDGREAVDMGAGDDSVTIGAEAQIFGDILLGSGDDLLEAQEAKDDLHVYGGAGDDELQGGAGDDELSGDADDDRLFGGAGDDLLDGGTGDDLLDGGAGDDILLGRAGDDELQGGAGNDRLDGGAGDDLLIGGAGNDTLDGGAGNDTVSYAGETANLNVNLGTGLATGAGRDRLQGIENVIGGAGHDVLIGNAQANILSGGAGNDHLTIAGGDMAYGGAGNDTIVAQTKDSGAMSVDGGAGRDLLQLAGTASGVITSTSGIEQIEALSGDWSVNVHSDVEYVHVYNKATLTSGVRLDNHDTLGVLQGFGGERDGAIRTQSDALIWAGGGQATVANYGEISVAAGNRLLQTTEGATGGLTITNMMWATMTGAFSPTKAGAAGASITINNQGTLTAEGRVVDFDDFAADGARFTLNNGVTGVIAQTGTGTDIIRAGEGGVINNHGIITAADGVVDAGDAIDFREGAGGVVNNYANARVEGAKHAITGDKGVTVLNEGTLIGRNGSAVNIDNGAVGAGVVTLTNARSGVMEGRSAGLADSDGDAIDVDGILHLVNAGRIEGMGANGAKDGEANVSEALAIGGGTILNQQGGQIIGHGRAIQVDNSGNGPAAGATLITNHGLISGKGHGPTGATAAEMAGISLIGNEAINLVGTQDDQLINGGTGTILGGIFMGAGQDRLENHGTIRAIGGTAVDLGEGDDTFVMRAGTISGVIDLGAGNDRFEAEASVTSALHIAAGAGDDFVRTGAGDDIIHAGSGDDIIVASTGRDVIDGGEGFDVLDLSAIANPITVDMRGGWLRSADQVVTNFSNIESLAFGDGDNIVSGGAGADVFDGGAGDDQLAGGSGNDVLLGGEGDDQLDGGSGADRLEGGAGDDLLKGGSGHDVIIGGAGDDVIQAGSGDDRIEGGSGHDLLSGGSGEDTFFFAANFGKDRITDFAKSEGDILEFSADLFANFADVAAAAQQSGTDVVITYDADNQVTLQDTALNSLSQDDFRFV